MGCFYLDESIRDRGGFILGALLYANRDIGGSVADMLSRAGLKPGVDEFKSSARISGTPGLEELRQRLRRSVYELGIKAAVVVSPTSDRHKFGEDVLLLLKKVLENNSFESDRNTAYIDQGIFQPGGRGLRLATDLGLPDGLVLEPSADSKLMGGIQLADLAANNMATMLMEALGLDSKMVKAGPDSGYDPDLEIELGFELWAGLRYSFFCRPVPGQEESPFMDVESVGLLVSSRCSPDLAEAARRCFGVNYLGCIH